MEAFEGLVEALTESYPAFERSRLQRSNRKRAIGAGGKFKLPLPERVVMTLLFLCHYPTFALLGFLFGLHESNAYRNVEMMKEFLGRHLPLPERVRKERISSLGELSVPFLPARIKRLPLLLSFVFRLSHLLLRCIYEQRNLGHLLQQLTQVVVGKEDGLIMDVSLGMGWKEA